MATYSSQKQVSRKLLVSFFQENFEETNSNWFCITVFSRWLANSFQIIRRCKTKTNCNLQWGLPALNTVYWNVFVLKSHRFHAILTFVRLVLVIHLKFFTIVQRTDYVKFKLYFPLLGKHHLQSTYYFWQFAVFVCARHCCADTGN